MLRCGQPNLTHAPARCRNQRRLCRASPGHRHAGSVFRRTVDRSISPGASFGTPCGMSLWIPGTSTDPERTHRDPRAACRFTKMSCRSPCRQRLRCDEVVAVAERAYQGASVCLSIGSEQDKDNSAPNVLEFRVVHPYHGRRIEAALDNLPPTTRARIAASKQMPRRIRS